MSRFQNSPQIKTNSETGEVLNRRWKHNETHVNCYGINVHIKAEGKVVLRKDISATEFDEIEIPASVIFDVAKLLKMTRSEVYLPANASGSTAKSE